MWIIPNIDVAPVSFLTSSSAFTAESTGKSSVLASPVSSTSAGDSSLVSEGMFSVAVTPISFRSTVAFAEFSVVASKFVIGYLSSARSSVGAITLSSRVTSA